MENKMTELLELTGICPILATAPTDAAVPAAKALAEGGLPVLEVLLKNEDSVTNIANIAKDAPEVIVGAGTVLSVAQAERVIDLGARFCVLPGFSPKVVEYCLKRGVKALPGCVTPTEIMMALDYGITDVKFFPVFQMGGIATLSQYNGGPFPNVRFVVTGALHSGNFLELVSYKNTLAAGGDWMFQDENALARRDYPQITRNVQVSLQRVLDMRAANKYN